MFPALNMRSMSQAMPPQPPPPQYPLQYPVPYQPPQYGQQYGQYGQRYGQLYGQEPLQYQQEVWKDSDVKEEWERDPIPPPPPQYYQQHHPAPPPPQQPQQQPPAPSPPQDEAPVVPKEAAAFDDLPIEEEQVEEPKMDTGEPGHRCAERVPRVLFVRHVVSRCVPGTIVSCAHRFARSARCLLACPW